MHYLGNLGKIKEKREKKKKKKEKLKKKTSEGRFFAPLPKERGNRGVG
jgi:hypothetical protein